MNLENENDLDSILREFSAGEDDLPVADEAVIQDEQVVA